MSSNSPWLTIQQAGEYCQVSRRTVESWLKDGLRHSRVGRCVRIHQDWLDEFLTSFSEESKADAIVAEIAREMGKR